MSTVLADDMLSSVLFGKTRRAVLTLLYGRPEESFHIRHILRVVNAGHGAVQRELRQLTDAGIISRTVRGHQVFYEANRDSAIFRELKSLITKTAGAAETVRAALSPLADRIVVAFVYGSVAKGDERRGSDIDLLVVGEVSFAEVVAELQPAQETLGREINPTVYPVVEFQQKVAEGQHFPTNVLMGPKIFLIGGERELDRMAPGRTGR